MNMRPSRIWTENCRLRAFLLTGMAGLVCLTGFAISPPAFADVLENRLGIGTGSSGLYLRYGITPRFTIEARGIDDGEVRAYGPRLYYHFNPEDRLVLNAGFEADLIRFGFSDISGDGNVIYLFVGGEYFINDNFSLGIDVGPAFTRLQENEYKITTEGVDYLANIGIYWTFSPFGSPNQRSSESRPSNRMTESPQTTQTPESARQASARDVAGYLETGNQAFQRRDYQRASECYAQAIQLAPNDVLPFYNLAMVYYAIEDYTTTRQVLLDALKRDSNHCASHLFLADCYYRQGDLPNAISQYRIVLDLQPDNQLARNNLNALNLWQTGWLTHEK